MLKAREFYFIQKFDTYNIGLNKSPECGQAQPCAYLFETKFLSGTECPFTCHLTYGFIAVNKLFLKSEIYKPKI